MPPKGSRKRAAVDDYEDDGGFVEDAPKSKKTKAAPVKEAKGKTEASESQYWELGRTRRVQINEFKGKQLVDFREFYEKDEEMLPGRKGISLNIEQFTTFIEQLPEIEKALKAKGVAIPRPAYDGVPTKAVEEDEEEEDKEEDAGEPEQKAIAAASEDEEIVKTVKASRLDRFKHKANHEATSEEDN